MNDLSFSSISKGCLQIHHLTERDQEIKLKLMVDENLADKIQKRMQKYPDSVPITFNGVHLQSAKLDERAEITATIGRKHLQQTNFETIDVGEWISVGMASKNRGKWLLHPYPAGKATFVEWRNIVKHQHTKEFIFQLDKSVFLEIGESEYIGLDGTGLLVQRKWEQNEEYFISVFIGKQTRERTVLDYEKISKGICCNVSLPAVSKENSK